MARSVTTPSVLLILVVSLIWAVPASADEGPENPYELPVIGDVQLAKSDDRAIEFYDNVLPTFMAFIDQNLKERAEFESAPDFVLDPTKLYLPLPTDQPVRVYFLHEGAGYRNQLGIAVGDAGHGRNGMDPLVDPLGVGQLIFLDASFEEHPDGEFPNLPLHTGDFVDIGNIESGMQMDFFLISNGANGGQAVLRNFEELNSDKLQHVIAMYFADEFPGYILIGFEDIVGGGDLDYNDCLFVVDVGVDVDIDESDLPH